MNQNILNFPKRFFKDNFKYLNSSFFNILISFHLKIFLLFCNYLILQLSKVIFVFYIIKSKFNLTEYLIIEYANYKQTYISVNLNQSTLYNF